MKRTMFILCFMFIGIRFVSAEVEPKKHSWDLGAELSHIKYKEPNLMEEKGMMYGITGSYVYHNLLNKIMLKAEGKGGWGQIDYSSPSSGTMDDIDDYMMELRVAGGYDFSIWTTTMLTPYLGIGYRYLNDDSSGMTTTTGALGYERESNYIYSPIGIATITELQNEWSVGLALEYDFFWKGIQKSHLSNVGLGYNDLENDQDDGYGVKGSVKVQKKTEKLDFIIEPFIRYWNIKKSEEKAVTYAGVIIGYGYEPKNSSIEYGLKIAAQF